MDIGHTKQLLYRFKDIPKEEVMQEIRIAEFQAEDRGKRLAFMIALRNLQDIDRKRRAYQRRFFCMFGDGADGAANTVAFIGGEQTDGFFDELELRDIVGRLPLPARKLAEFAKIESERFEDVPYGVWYLHNLMELRRRIKRRYIEWDRDHSEKSYLRARATLTAALRQHGGRNRG